MATLEHLPSVIDSAHPLARAARTACESVTGVRTDRAFVSGLDRCGIVLELRVDPCVILGPGDLSVAHTPWESVPVSQVIDAVSIYRDAARLLLRRLVTGRVFRHVFVDFAPPSARQAPRSAFLDDPTRPFWVQTALDPQNATPHGKARSREALSTFGPARGALMRRFPHTYVLLLLLVALAALRGRMSFPPARSSASKKTAVSWSSPGPHAERPAHPAGVGDVFMAWPRGLKATASIVFYIFLIGGTFGVINATGAVDAAISAVVRAGAAAVRVGPDRVVARLLVGRRHDRHGGRDAALHSRALVLLARRMVTTT